MSDFDFEKIKPAVEEISLNDIQKAQILNACKGKSRYSSLVTGHKIDCPEPFLQWEMAVVDHGIRGKRGLVPTLSALVTTISTNRIAVSAPTLGANKTMRPFERIQVLRTGFLSGKPFDKPVETQCFLFGHFWHLPFGASILLLVSNISDVFPYLVSCLLKPITLIPIYPYTAESR